MRTEAERLRELLAINRAITGTADYDAVLRLIVEKACALTEFAKASLVLLGEPGARAIVVASIGIEPAKLQGFDAILDERVTTVLRDRLSLATEGDVLAVPMIVRGNLRGILAVIEPQTVDAKLRAEHEWLLAALADQAGIALGNASHLTDTEAALATSRRLADELTKSEARIREVIELAPEAFFLANLDSRYIDVNRAACRMLGYTREELLSKTFFDVIPPEDAERLVATRAELLAQRQAVTGEWTLVRKDGSRVAVEVSTNILPDDRWQAFVRDIGERKRREDERQVFISLLENSSDFIGIADPSGKPIYVNPAGRRMVGLPLDFPVEETQMPEYYPPEERRFAADVIVKSMVDEGHWSGETYFRNWQTGERIPVSDEHFMIRDATGKRVLGMGTVTRDISAARRILDRLRESEERFRLTIDEAPIGMALVALDGRFVRVNHRLCESVGYSRAELERLRFQDITHPEDLDKDVALSAQLARGEIPRVQLDKRYIRKDGSIVPVQLTASLLHGHGGEPRYFITQIEDISERKRAEEALRASEERLSLAVEAAGVGLWDWDLVADEAHLSPRYWELIGREPGAHRADFAFFKSLIHPGDLPSVENAMAAHLQGRTALALIEYRVRKPSGEDVWLTGYGRVTARAPDGKPQRMVGVIVDITERKRRELEQQFLAEVGAAFAASLDYEQTLATVGQLVVRELADWCIVELVEEGPSTTTRLKVASADPRQASLAAELETVRLDRSRRHFASPVLETTQPFLLERVTPEDVASFAQSPEHLRMLRAIEPRSLLEVPLLIRGRLSGILIFISSNAARTYTSADIPLAEALAERAALAIENGRLYREAVHATQMRDEVLGVVAHDLRNPVASILMRCQLAQRAIEEGGTQAEFTRIERSAKRMNRLIRDLLDISTIEAGHLGLERSRVSAARLVSEAVETQRLLVESASLRVALEVTSELPDVWGDPHRLQQVLENLIGNAIKFTAPGGYIAVGASPADGEVRFWVSDTGCGIPPEALAHVFERFWQARRGDRKGAGLGLPITRGIVEAHGGRIWVESTPGHGSTFFFTIPQASRVQTAASPRP